MWRLTDQLHGTAREFHNEREKAEALLNGGSETSSKNNSVQSITEEEKEAGEKAFADFNYNKDKSKKASLVITSINDEPITHDEENN